MKIRASKAHLSGSVTVPGSKSHTIRALLLSSLAEGTSHIFNPLPSADCLSTARAIPLMGAKVDLHSESENVWTVFGAGKNIHLPSDVVNVGDSGSLLYFMSPIASTFEGWSVFTGDESIRRRPVNHVVDALNQLGAECFTAIPSSNACPLIIKGPVSSEKTVRTEGEVSSQYVSGMMMAALRLKGKLCIELSNPKETPYITMTQKWLEKIGARVFVSPDFKKISVEGPEEIKAFDTTVPSDWEGVAFPLIAALLTDSDLLIEHVDGSGTQGDDEIVSVLKSIGADIVWDKNAESLRVRGMKKSSDGIGRLSTLNLPGGELHVDMASFPDAICALAVIACFTEGKCVLEDAEVCRRKETDRLKVMTEILTGLGAQIEEGPDFLVIKGHSPILADGSVNPEFCIHGGSVESFDDHRIAMSLACLGLGLPEGESLVLNNAECCAVSFPSFFETMNKLGASFEKI